MLNYNITPDDVGFLPINQCKELLCSNLLDYYGEHIDCDINPNEFVYTLTDDTIRSMLKTILEDKIEKEKLSNIKSTHQNDLIVSDEEEVYALAKQIYIELISRDTSKMYTTEFNPVKYSVDAAKRFVKYYKKHI